MSHGKGEEREEQSSSLHPWRIPSPYACTTQVLSRMYPLMIYNSLTRSKVRFIPKDPQKITWYQCGPTVYAESHIGHARTYVGLDIIRRIAKDFLGYNIILCQNITDIDDKIIIRSSERGIDFRDLASQYETEFMEDMQALGVPLPDIVTRVSEYVPEIILFIQTLVDKGIAYESNGSVYFSTTNFQTCGHKYGKLMPEQIGNSELLAEGEGALVISDEKRSPTDFVLWKKTKEHANGMFEPSWESPWGSGRPGWHIECSAMSRFALDRFGGTTLDVHAGGIDLKFPHHENEIAQSEGYQGCNQWVNYWMHTGHLNIKGLKMSKSLKNFITIREALEVHTSRQIRFCFLLHKYNSPMDYSDNTMTHAVSIERKFAEFFHNVKAVLRSNGMKGSQHVGTEEHNLLVAIEGTKESVRNAFLDDFDTPRAITCLLDLVKHCNLYIEANFISTSTLTSAAKYITSILKIVGIIPDNVEIGFQLETVGGSGVSKEELLTPFLDVLTKFRETVRSAAISGDTKAVLSAADALRDDILPDLGVRMEDKGSGTDVVSIWKLCDPEELRKERALKEETKREKERLKQEKALELANKQKEKEERAKINPKEMFLSQVELYSAFNEEGLPTHNKAGEPLPKGTIKKLQKDQAKQKELYDKYIQTQES